MGRVTNDSLRKALSGKENAHTGFFRERLEAKTELTTQICQKRKTRARGSGTLGFCVEIEAQGNEPVEFGAALRNWAYGSKPNKIQHCKSRHGYGIQVYRAHA